MVSRSDLSSSPIRNQELYSDFMVNFDKTPFGGDLAKITNARAVGRSIRNLVLTNKGERLYQPDIGTDILKSLFELDTPPITSVIEMYVKTTIKNYEPRANLISVTASMQIQQTLVIVVVYSLINTTEPITLTILQRIR